MSVGRAVAGAGDARIFPSMEKCCYRKIRSRPPGYANLFESPAPATARPTLTPVEVARFARGHEGGRGSRGVAKLGNDGWAFWRYWARSGVGVACGRSRSGIDGASLAGKVGKSLAASPVA